MRTGSREAAITAFLEVSRVRITLLGHASVLVTARSSSLLPRLAVSARFCEEPVQIRAVDFM